MLKTLDAVAYECTGVEAHEADRDEVMAVLEQQARQWLRISAADFLTALEAGEFDEVDDPATARLISTARLLG